MLTAMRRAKAAEAGHLDDRPQLAEGELLVDGSSISEHLAGAHTLIIRAFRRNCSWATRRHSAGPSASRRSPWRASKSPIHGSG
jgi:hypothetical protein